MAYLALLFNALVWGVSWWPLRQLQSAGLHPLWATMLAFLMGVVLIGMTHPSAWRAMRQAPSLWLLAAISGATNAAFNWGVSVGDVVRVVLLFYLMPLWAVLLARWLLKEPITAAAVGRMVLALVGAVLVLKPEGQISPRFGGLGDVLGLLGGMGFALTNVLLRLHADTPTSARALAMFSGGLVLPGVAGALLCWQGLVTPLPEPHMGWVLLAMALGVAFLASNMAYQYGASRISVNTTSIVMLTEVVFASGSAVAWGGASLSPTVLSGGGLILMTALWASLSAA